MYNKNPAPVTPEWPKSSPPMNLTVHLEWEGAITERDVVLLLYQRSGTGKYDIWDAVWRRCGGDYDFDKIRLAYHNPKNGPMLTEPFNGNGTHFENIVSGRRIDEYNSLRPTVMLIPRGYVQQEMDDLRCTWCHKPGAKLVALAELLPFCSDRCHKLCTPYYNRACGSGDYT